MDFDKMLQDKKCDCGMTHSCSIKKVVIGSGAVEQVSSLLGSYQKILLVADSNTYRVCGRQVEEQIACKLENHLIYERDGLLVPNEEAVCEMEQKLTKATDLIIGVGFGVIQDLCKYVCYQAKLPYYVVETAPSMDGYASKGAAMI